jgi:hypothetical protein
MKLRMFVAALGAVLALGLAGPALAQSSNAGRMPAFYDCNVFTINFTVLPPDAAKKILADPSMQFNTIYVFPDCPSFLMVLDAITGVAKEPVPRSGFNPLWQVVNVTFNNNTCPANQNDFCKDDLITGSTAVTLTPTDMLVRCSVLGPSK